MEGYIEIDRFLSEEVAIPVRPFVAVVLGDRPAMFLQQLHYWSMKENAYVCESGHRWVRNSIERWQENFPFWSISTIRRVIAKLEEKGVIVSETSTGNKTDRTKMYRIDRKALNSIPVEEYENNYLDGYVEKIAHVRDKKIPTAQTGQMEDSTVQNEQNNVSRMNKTDLFSTSKCLIDYKEISKENGASTSTEKKKIEKKSVEENQIDKKNENIEKRELSLQEKKEGSEKILQNMKKNMAKKTKRKSGSKFANNPILEIWSQAYKENYDLDIPHFQGKEIGQLKNVHKGYPEFYADMVKACLSDWKGFCFQVMSATDLTTYPQEPHTGFFCTHARHAYHFYLEKPLESVKTQSSDSDFEGDYFVPDI